jgi:hypothetical protein
MGYVPILQVEGLGQPGLVPALPLVSPQQRSHRNGALIFQPTKLKQVEDRGREGSGRATYEFRVLIDQAAIRLAYTRIDSYFLDLSDSRARGK